MSKQKKEDYNGLPDYLISQISEFSTGGFVIFIRDKDGNITVRQNYDSTPDSLGLREFIRVWGNVAKKIDENAIAAQILGVNPEDLEEEE